MKKCRLENCNANLLRCCNIQGSSWSVVFNIFHKSSGNNGEQRDAFLLKWLIKLSLNKSRVWSSYFVIVNIFKFIDQFFKPLNKVRPSKRLQHITYSSVKLIFHHCYIFAEDQYTVYTHWMRSGKSNLSFYFAGLGYEWSWLRPVKVNEKIIRDSVS